MNQTILLAGSTGMLGSRIARHLLDQPGAHLRLLVRSAASPALKPFLDRGAEIIEGSLTNPASLDRATRGVDVIVSAVQGGADVIIDGQVALARAGKRNGVRRILPSDFALDLFKATPGESAAFDMRRQADEQIAATGLEQVNILQGAFMDVVMPGMGSIDLEAGTVGFYGNGDEPFEVTSLDDTARMTAKMALDRGVPPGKFAFAGDRISFRDAGRIIGERAGQVLRPVSFGSEADLRAAMAGADPDKRVMLGYLLCMLTGQTSLDALQNDRYPDVPLETFGRFVERKLPPAVS